MNVAAPKKTWAGPSRPNDARAPDRLSVEDQLIASLVARHDEWAKADSAGLTLEHFAGGTSRDIVTARAAIAARREVPTAEALVEELRVAGRLEEVSFDGLHGREAIFALRAHASKLGEDGGPTQPVSWYCNVILRHAEEHRDARARAELSADLLKKEPLDKIAARLNAQIVARRRAAEDSEGPTAAEPLRGLQHLGRVALMGRARLLALAEKQVVFLWQDMVTAGLIVMIAGGPGSGKTTLLFLILAARMNVGAAVSVLDRLVTPAAAGRRVVLIEAEHGETSTVRKLAESCRALGISDEALDRIIIVARKGVCVGSPEWDEVGQQVAAGLVSDVAIDTLARCAPGDANDESEQAAIFAAIAALLDRAPTEADKPVAWVLAHTRKGDGEELSDVSGSAQRTGQADVVLMVKPTRVNGQVTSSKVTVLKLRDAADEYPQPVEYTLQAGALAVSEASTPEATASERKPRRPRAKDDKRPLQVRIAEHLRDAGKPCSKWALCEALGRNSDDIGNALTDLFSNREIESFTDIVNKRAVSKFRLRSGRYEHRTSTGPHDAPDEDE